MACPRCERANENLDHILRKCPVSVEFNEDYSDARCRLYRLTETSVFMKDRSGKVTQWVPLFRAFIKINFDGAFDKCRFRSSSRVVVRSVEGVVLVSSTVLHEDIGSTFAAEALACF
ncbi:hypothetical protein Golob_020099 [Gossypium lobatum]|uniref:Reverse transcriptase zinc-binding domain-containing protein n=1 Tax=Gossypium lobatum TaxID=34289 RepID=A0A7J8L9C0_9ROSI|nr:hypothetical protein [Gossypium lobatum]